MSDDLQVDIQFSYATGFDLDVNFVAARGVVTQLVGPSGSGKSTVLSLIAGLKKPDAGSVSIGDRVLFSADDSVDVKPWRRGVGLLFQTDTLFPHMTVKQNLFYGARRMARSPWSAEAVCRALQIEDLLSRKPQQLSGGQRDRVSLGRTLMSQPKLLLLDEPLNSVEPELRESIFDFVARGAAERALPMVLVSHDSGLRSQATGPVCHLDGGMSKFAG